MASGFYICQLAGFRNKIWVSTQIYECVKHNGTHKKNIFILRNIWNAWEKLSNRERKKSLNFRDRLIRTSLVLQVTSTKLRPYQRLQFSWMYIICGKAGRGICLILWQALILGRASFIHVDALSRHLHNSLTCVIWYPSINHSYPKSIEITPYTHVWRFYLRREHANVLLWKQK